MFFHAMHIMNHAAASQGGAMGLHPAQVCSLAGSIDAGVICSCAARALSCPNPEGKGTTNSLKVSLPNIAVREERTNFLISHPNYAFEEAKNALPAKPAVACATMSPLVSAGLIGC